MWTFLKLSAYKFRISPVYLLDKAESDSMHGSIGDKYFGKMEFMVE